MRKFSRALALFLLCAFLLGGLCVFLCASVGFCHNCVGKGCSVCALIGSAGEQLRRLCFAGAALFAVAPLLLFILTQAEVCLSGTVCGTPVTLKVKLLD